MNTKIKEAFDKVHAEEELKSHTKEFLRKKTNGYQKRHMGAYKGLVAAAFCLVFLFIGWKGYSAYFIPSIIISMDINPSIELGINRFDKVVSVETYNEDGSKVMSAVDINYLNYRDALERILSDKSMEQYLTKDMVIAVTVFGTSEDKENEMMENVTACTRPYGKVHCSSCNSEEADAAHAAGLSLGKYKAFLELQALDPDITVEDVQGLTMRQIRDMIDDLSGDETIYENGYGNGYGRGNGSCHGYGGGQGGRCHQHGEIGE